MLCGPLLRGLGLKSRMTQNKNRDRWVRREHTGETSTKIMSGDLRSNLSMKEHTNIRAEISSTTLQKGLRNITPTNRSQSLHKNNRIFILFCHFQALKSVWIIIICNKLLYLLLLSQAFFSRMLTTDRNKLRSNQSQLISGSITDSAVGACQCLGGT